MNLRSSYAGKLAALLLTFSLISILPARAMAWGSDGHGMVARIASRLLTPQARNKVQSILGPHNENIVSVALWADGIRGPEPGKRPETPNWHFADTPLGEDYSESRDCSESPNGSCVISALVMFQDILADKKKGYYDRKFNSYEALKFIIHFSGDIHQPLHNITDKRNDQDGDTGGNAKKVIWFGVADKNLHGVWDTDILRRNMRLRNNADVVAYSNFLFDSLTQQERDMARPSPSGSPTVLSRSAVEDWAKNAHEIAENAYSDIGSPNSQGQYTLSQSYYNAHKAQVDLQIKRAGVRLARILNENLR